MNCRIKELDIQVEVNIFPLNNTIQLLMCSQHFKCYFTIGVLYVHPSTKMRAEKGLALRLGLHELNRIFSIEF